MKRYIGILLVTIVFGCTKTTDEDWRTYYEKSNYLETPRYEETLRYLDRLEKSSRWIKVTYFGVSPEGRKMPLVVVDKSGKFTPESARSQNKVVLLVQAGIHAGEIDGKDAMLMLLRNMAIYHQYTELLDHVTILFMPFFNVDGHERVSAYNRFNQNGPKEMGWRVTSQNLNL
ncbi:peptidase M14, partial [bacterium]|nr:peptidase M14 [bacterium]